MASTSAAPPPLDRAALNRAFAAIDSSNIALRNELNGDLVALKAIAEDIEKYEPGSDKIQALDSTVLEMIDIASEVDRHKGALASLSASSDLCSERGDMERLIEAEVNKQPAAPSAKNSQYYKQFQEAIWNVHHAGIPMPGREQDDILITSNTGVLNRICPISGKPVTELREPVRGAECGHIYERDAVMRYIARKSNQRCAAAGCPRILLPQSLVCDAALEMDIQELRLRGIDGNTGVPPDLMDLDEDGDEDEE